jgi:membrane-associated phospholipid phosphatase
MRERPPWRKLPAFRCMIGEQYSFPSGHAMRAFYTAAVFAGQHGPDWGLVAPGAPLLALRVALAGYAVAVGWSRVALGRHFASDVAAGACVGLLLAWGGYADTQPAGSVRVGLASLFTAQAVYVAASAGRRRAIPGWPCQVGILAIFWASLPIAA